MKRKVTDWIIDGSGENEMNRTGGEEAGIRPESGRQPSSFRESCSVRRF